MRTRFDAIYDDWRLVKNECRVTDNKGFTEHDASQKFRRMLLISEHSPIRLLRFVWTWSGIPYWVSTEWSRHKFEKFISTQRDDRLPDVIPRGKKPQDAPVNFGGEANMQHLIDAWRKRLCYSATLEANELAVDFKLALAASGHKAESDVLVPHCVYRCGCPEPNHCGFFRAFEEYADEHEHGATDWRTDIQARYDLYNQFFDEMHGGARHE